ncbi:lipoprotein [Kitasatospora kifunensis]
MGVEITMTTSRATRTLLPAAATVLLAAALSGCGGTAASGGSADASAAGTASQSPVADKLADDPVTAVRNAADITGRTGSAQATTELTTESGEKKAAFTGAGPYDYVNRIGRIEVQVPPGAATTGKVVEVVEPGIVFLQNSGAKVPAGKWVKLDVRQLADGNLISNGATDPASAAGALRGVQQASVVGDETLDGVPLKHYKGTLDLAKAADATGGQAANGLRMAASTFTVKDVPFEAWLDAQGRLHKVTEVFTFAGVAGSKDPKDQVKVTSTVSLSAFGQPVQVTEPAAADVVEMKDSSSPK